MRCGNCEFQNIFSKRNFFEVFSDRDLVKNVSECQVKCKEEMIRLFNSMLGIWVFGAIAKLKILSDMQSILRDAIKIVLFLVPPKK